MPGDSSRSSQLRGGHLRRRHRRQRLAPSHCPFARKYGFAARYHAVVPYSGSSVTETYGLMARAGEIALDGADGRPVVRVTRPVTRISTQKAGFDANRYVSANLGTGVLQQFDVTFDYAGRRIVLVKNRHFGELDTFSPSGMRVKRVKTATPRLVVETVFAGGAAEHAGVRAGDVVLAVDDVPATSLDGDGLAAHLNRANGATVKLRLAPARGSAPARDVSLVLHDLL